MNMNITLRCNIKNIWNKATKCNPESHNWWIWTSIFMNEFPKTSRFNINCKYSSEFYTMIIWFFLLIPAEDGGFPEEFAKWKRADLNNDDKLTEKEFLYFQHPEHNPNSIKEMASDMVVNFDRNKDKVHFSASYKIPFWIWSRRHIVPYSRVDIRASLSLSGLTDFFLWPQSSN